MVVDGVGQSKHLEEMRLSVLEKILLLNLNAVLDKELPILFGKCHVTMGSFCLAIHLTILSLSRRLYEKPAYSFVHPSKSGK